MGINQLWTVMRPLADTSDTLPALALREGFVNSPTKGGYRVGVDASIMARQIMALCANARGLKDMRQPRHHTLAHRLGDFLHSCLDLTFVWDSKDSSHDKPGSDDDLEEIWFFRDFRTAVEHCGWRNVIARKEADADLAEMSRLGLISAVLTNDSDLFPLGGTRIISMSSYTGPEAKIEVYEPPYALPWFGSDGVTREDFILIALLAGGVYDPTGLRGCGIKTAVQVARYGLGKSLCRAVDTMAGGTLRAFLERWRNELRGYLRDDPEGFLEQRHVKLATSIPTTFPNLRVLKLYLHPSVSDFTNSPLHAPPEPRFPNPVASAELYDDERVYEDTRRILRMFRQDLWRGLVFREVWLQAFACVNDLEHPINRGLFHYQYDTVRVEQDDTISIKVVVNRLDQYIQDACGPYGGASINDGLIKTCRVKLPIRLVEEAQNSGHTWAAHRQHM